MATSSPTSLRGDLGVSLYTNRPVTTDIAQFLPATLELVFVVRHHDGADRPAARHPVGALSRQLDRQSDPAGHAARRLGAGLRLGGDPDAGLRLFLPLFPIAGRISDTITIAPVTGFLLIDTLVAGNFKAFGNAAWHIVLPAFALALSGIGQAARLTRSNMVETYDKPYIEMAQSYGFPEKRIANRYAFRPSLIPSLTIIGLDFAAMLGNAFLVEAVFAWPGLSRYGVAVILQEGPQRHHRHGADHLGDVPDRQRHRRPADRLHQSAHPLLAEGGLMKRTVAILLRNPLSLLGLVLIALVVLSAIFADFITPFPEHVGAVVDFANFNKPPAWPYIWAPTSSAATSSPASSTPTASR